MEEKLTINYASHYQWWHPETEEHFIRTRDGIIRRYARLLPSNKSSAVLDVGCGVGFFVAACQHLGFKDSRGIDIDPGQIVRGAQRGLPVECVPDSLAWLKTNPASFDFIGCFDVLEHLTMAEQYHLTKAMVASLRENGRLVCKVPNANASFGGRWRYIDFTHKASFTEHSLEFLLRESGLSSIRIEEEDDRPKMPWVLRPKLRWWYLRQLFRLVRRFEAMAELGTQVGRYVPLSLNIVGIGEISQSRK